MASALLENLVRRSIFEALADLFLHPSCAGSLEQWSRSVRSTAALAAEFGLPTAGLDAIGSHPAPTPEEARRTIEGFLGHCEGREDLGRTFLAAAQKLQENNPGALDAHFEAAEPLLTRAAAARGASAFAGDLRSHIASVQAIERTLRESRRF